MDLEAMKKYADDLWKEAQAIKSNALKMCWYMRGGVTYLDILNMSSDEINQINAIIEDNLETTKKSKLPFF